MRTLEELQKQIETTEDLRSIVRTMKALAAVSIHQFEHAAASMAEYERTVKLGLQALLRHPKAPRIQTYPGTGARGVVVFGSDHGLCGRFNDQIVALALDQLCDADKCHLVAVGLRAAARLEALGQPVDTRLTLPGSVNGIQETVQAILLTVDRWRTEHGVSRVTLCHNRRTEEAFATPRKRVLLPLDVERLRQLAREPWPSRALPMFTMAPERLLSALVRQLLFGSLFQACTESLVSEHASRLAAMQAAEGNIADRLDEMHAEFRRRRQQSITEELLDVVTGFETLRASD